MNTIITICGQRHSWRGELIDFDPFDYFANLTVDARELRRHADEAGCTMLEFYGCDYSADTIMPAAELYEMLSA